MIQLSDKALQMRVLELAEVATRLYAKGSGGLCPPEHFVQNYCAAKLIEDGLVVTAETGDSQFKEWFQVAFDPDMVSRFRIDLIIWDPAGHGIPKNSNGRALVEFKLWPKDIAGDVDRTARLVAKVADPKVFGFVVTAGTMFADASFPTAQIAQVEQIAREGGGGAVFSRRFEETIPGEGLYHGVVIGLHLKPSDVTVSA